MLATSQIACVWFAQLPQLPVSGHGQHMLSTSEGVGGAKHMYADIYGWIGLQANNQKYEVGQKDRILQMTTTLSNLSNILLWVTD